MANKITSTFTISPERLKYLKMLVHQISLERNSDLSFTDLINEALDKCYPSPAVNVVPPATLKRKP